MFLSKPVFASALALGLAAAPALAAEVAPLDDAALGQVTALSMGDLALLSWFPAPAEHMTALPAAGFGTDQLPRTDGLILSILRLDRSTMSLERQDGSGTISRIFQTAKIDLPHATESRIAEGVIVQSGGYEIGGGQSATNLAVAATLNGAGAFGSIGR
jgi:hypothetical protein